VRFFLDNFWPSDVLNDAVFYVQPNTKLKKQSHLINACCFRFDKLAIKCQVSFFYGHLTIFLGFLGQGYQR